VDLIASASAVITQSNELGGKAYRLVKAIGPLAVSLSDRGSSAYVTHQKRLVDVESVKVHLASEVSTISDVRKRLLEKFVDADAEVQLDIKSKLKFLEEEARQYRVYLDAIRIGQEQTASSGVDGDKSEIEPAWLDRFNELARKQNEVWRCGLLARALALELENPGAIGMRALWVIGTLELELFNAFSAIIDLSVVMNGNLMIPIGRGNEFNFPIPNYPENGRYTISNVVFILAGLDVIGDSLTSKFRVASGESLSVAYAGVACRLDFKVDTEIAGVPLTRLGMKVASLYDAKSSEFGLEIFSNWVDGFTLEQVDKHPVPGMLAL
jgi:Protein of unknown function (DUF2806)